MKDLNDHLGLSSSNFEGKGQSTDKIDRQLLEKDKIIFEYSKLLKDSERKIDQLKKAVLSKEEINLSMKDEIKELQFKLKTSENSSIRKDEVINKLKFGCDEKIKEVCREKEILNAKLHESTKSGEANQIERQSLLLEIRKIEKNHHKLKQQLQEKHEHSVQLEKTVEETKKELAMLSNLKKHNAEQDLIIKQLLTQLDKEKRDNESFIREKDEIENHINSIINDNKVSKELTMLNSKLSTDNDSLRHELHLSQNQVNSLNEKLKTAKKEFDDFFNYTISDINSLLTLIDNLNDEALKSPLASEVNELSSHDSFIYSKTLIKSKAGKFADSRLSVISKNLETIRNLFIGKLQKKLGLLTKLEGKVDQYEESNRSANDEISSLKKRIILMDSELNEMNDKQVRLSQSNNELNGFAKGLENELSNTNDKLREVLNKLNEIEYDYQLFLNELCNKIGYKPTFNYSQPLIKQERELKSTQESAKSPPSNSKFSSPARSQYNPTNCNSPKNQNKLFYSIISPNAATKFILNQIETFITDRSQHTLQEKESTAIIEELKSNIGEHKKEITSLTLNIHQLNQDKSTQLNSLNETKNSEMEEFKANMYGKIKTLTSLLEDSNNMINSLEGENTNLRRTSIKLERHLKILMESHKNLE